MNSSERFDARVAALTDWRLWAGTDGAKLLHHFERRISSVRSTPSIAIVGSSGTLMRRGHGKAIDRHDLVVRVNDARVAGHEADCGRDRHHAVVGWSIGIQGAARRGSLCCGALAIVTKASSRGNTSSNLVALFTGDRSAAARLGNHSADSATGLRSHSDARLGNHSAVAMPMEFMRAAQATLGAVSNHTGPNAVGSAPVRSAAIWMCPAHTSPY